MPERALALEAGAAFDAEPDDPRRGRKRRGVLWARRAEKRHQRPTERCGHVHQARIVGDHVLCAGDERDRLVQAGFADEVAAENSLRRLPVVGRAEDHAFSLEPRRELPEVGPALGRAVLGAWAEDAVGSVDPETPPGRL